MNRRWLWACLLVASGLAFAADAPDQSQADGQDPDRPEYRVRSLPSDTFNPSEKVQEDFPVPFPEDI
jgi:hypothetical protein